MSECITVVATQAPAVHGDVFMLITTVLGMGMVIFFLATR